MEGSDITVTVNLGREGAGAKDDFIAKYGTETKIIVLLAKTDDGAYQLSNLTQGIRRYDDTAFKEVSDAVALFVMTTPVVLRASLARSISYLDFEGLIPASRNIYLRFKGLPECGTRSISGCSALESCDSHGVYTRAPTPRNAVRCLSEPQSTPRNEDSPRISRSSFERRMCSTVKHADEQACQRRNDPSQLKLLQRQHVQYGL